MKSMELLLALVGAAATLAMVSPDASAQAARYTLTATAEAPAAPRESVDEAALVQETLDEFDSALALHDIGQLQAAGITPVTAKRWKRFFRNNPRATVTDYCPGSELAIWGNTATWNCLETATVISEGKPLPFEHFIRFTFVKKDGTWMIADRR